MKTVVINTSKEAQNTKLDILFKAPFDRDSLLWLEGELPTLGDQADAVRQRLLKDVDTVDRDYQLIVLVDLYPFPYGNDQQAVASYRMLLDKYIRHTLLLPLQRKHNLPPKAVALYFLDSATEIPALDVQNLVANPKEQERLERQRIEEEAKKRKKAAAESGDDLTYTHIEQKKEQNPHDSYEERILKQIFGWQAGMKQFTWTVKCSVTDETALDFYPVFESLAGAIAASDESSDLLGMALRGVAEPVQGTNLGRIGNFPVWIVTFWVSRENEQSSMESLFGVFTTIFTGVQEGRLLLEPMVLTREEITALLLNALKRYKYFSSEEHITVHYHPIEQIFKERDAICQERVEKSRKKKSGKAETDEQAAERIMGIAKNGQEKKKQSVDEAFRQMTERVFKNYDAEVIRAQNNELIKSCLEGLWKWRDEQTDESLRQIIDQKMGKTDLNGEKNTKRELIAFLEEDYEARRAQLIEEVTEAEHKLASNQNVLLETKKQMLKYGDYMRKGRFCLISCIGAIFTVLATVFPFFYADMTASSSNAKMHTGVLLVLALSAGLYGVASVIYMTYINRKKGELVDAMQKLVERSEGERKASIMVLHHYYNETVVFAESYCLLWREILRRDRENARKGIKRNYHIKRMKNLAAEVDRCITLMKLGVTARERSLTQEDEKEFAAMTLNGEVSCYDPVNKEAYCFLPFEEPKTKKGETDEE